MSIPTVAAAMTSAFLNSAGMETDRPEMTSFLGPVDTPSTIFMEPEGGEYIQLAQVDAENLLKGGAAILLCTTMTGKSPEECLRDLAGRNGTQLPDVTPQGPSQAGIRRVQDGYVSPDELGNVRAIAYYGDVYNNQRRRVALWDVEVRDYGPVCLGTLDDTAYPAQDTMQIAARESCDAQFRGRVIGREQQNDDILSLPPQDVPQAGYNRANGTNSAFGSFVSIDRDGEGYPFVAFGEHLRTGEVGCFLFENRDVEFAPRIDDGICTTNGANYPQP